LVRVVDADLEVVEALREVLRVGGTQLRELLLDLNRDAHRVRGIEPEVRVAERMHIAHRAIDDRRAIEDLDAAGDVEVTARALLDFRVATLVDERRQPADLEL